MTTTVTCELMRSRWTDPASRPLFKGKLIDPEGCCCAQGDVLRVMGKDDDDLRRMDQTVADMAVADALGISLFHSVLLRYVNDSAQGCPEKVLQFTNDGLGKVLGPSWRSVIAFGEHMSRMTDAQWAAAGAAARAAAWAAAGAAARAAAWAAAGAAAGAAARAAAWAAAGAAAWAAAGAAARAAAGAAAWDAAWDAARAAAGAAAWDAAGDAAWELVGWTKLTTASYFLKFFGITDAATFVAEAEKRWRD